MAHPNQILSANKIQQHVNLDDISVSSIIVIYGASISGSFAFQVGFVQTGPVIAYRSSMNIGRLIKDLAW